LTPFLLLEAIWADARSTGALYGIEPQQSAITGLPTFEPGSGWLNARFGLLWSFELSRQWVVVGGLEARRLQGDAAKSPLAERPASRYITAGLACRFGLSGQVAQVAKEWSMTRTGVAVAFAVSGLVATSPVQRAGVERAA
jgi:hypothetical protein